jgi:hypothetical protein
VNEWCELNEKNKNKTKQKQNNKLVRKREKPAKLGHQQDSDALSRHANL